MKAEQQSFEDNIKPVVTMEVKGLTLDEIMLTAKLDASGPLAVSPDRIYIVGHGSMTVADTVRYQKDKDARPAMWKCTVSCGIIPK